ncbi:U-box domain-containing protein 21-like [Iris pallida]|uniref:U-box domain-containing protein n=1 Tax=Iris pallida TaxID=29817 RepID=A0AAX6EMU1_IRIPA|nr:U-box domain-containing protein 21-like [Iris pallida]
MASSKRNPKPSKPTTKAQRPRAEPPGAVEVSIPNHFRCPISLDLMADPVTVSTGITYDRGSIETWLGTGQRTCPVTKRELGAADEDPVPNHSLRRMIQEWCVANRSLGVERVPTPKVPLTAARASEILSELVTSRGGGNYVVRCRELASRVGSLARESDRNRRCFVQAGAGRVLAALFGELAACGASADDEILSALALMLPLDKEACRHIAASTESFGAVASIMRSDDLASRLNAILVLKEVLSKGKEFVVRAARAEGLSEALVEFLRKPTSTRAAKAAMAAAFCLVSSDEGAATRLLDLGLVPLVLETLVESERSMCEKALAVLDAVCSTERGRDEARGHALTVPVLVKKMFRVSDAATEFVVSALWKLACRKCEGMEEEMRRGVLAEATQVGAFQKVLLLLQVGCGAATKEKATQLLKMMNGHRGRLDCMDTMDLRGLRKSF